MTRNETDRTDPPPGPTAGDPDGERTPEGDVFVADESELSREPDPSSSGEAEMSRAGTAEDEPVPANQWDEPMGPTDEDEAVVKDQPATVDDAQDDAVVDAEPSDTDPAASEPSGGEPVAAEPSTAPSSTAPLAVDQPFLADATGYQKRWNEIQTRFVDEPSSAVQSARELLTEVMDDLRRTLATELEARGGAGDEASTDDLRMAFQRYRSFFDRLLAA